MCPFNIILCRAAPLVRDEVTGTFMNNLVSNIPTGSICENDLWEILFEAIPDKIYVKAGFFRSFSAAKDFLPIVDLRLDSKENTMDLTLLICNSYRRSQLQGTVTEEVMMTFKAGFLTTEIWQGLDYYIPGFSLQSCINCIDASGATEERLLHGRQPARENYSERFELLGIITSL